ncbi:MAG TPA: hypothetical protein PKV91_03110 [Bacillota bacterium]|nr:hypothetical protein [Bacillota bacterium]HPZ11330.1 hypothetical protein [Bacillota bacterium]HQE09471.1 hypothetical protein [Bacillota bacterium]
MSKAIQKQCLICGRTFEVKVLDDVSPEWEKGSPGQSTSFCPLCEAKIKKEAGDAQKEPRSM